MTVPELLFGIFVAMPMAALCIVVIVGAYGVIPFVVWTWIRAGS